VHPANRTEQAGRAVYHIDPRSSGIVLRMELRQDDQTDRPIDNLSRPTRRTKADSRAKLDLERTESENNRNFSLLAHLSHTAYPDDCTLDLTTQFDPFLDF